MQSGTTTAPTGFNAHHSPHHTFGQSHRNSLELVPQITTPPGRWRRIAGGCSVHTDGDPSHLYAGHGKPDLCSWIKPQRRQQLNGFRRPSTPLLPLLPLLPPLPTENHNADVPPCHYPTALHLGSNYRLLEPRLSRSQMTAMCDSSHVQRRVI